MLVCVDREAVCVCVSVSVSVSVLVLERVCGRGRTLMGTETPANTETVQMTPSTACRHSEETGRRGGGEGPGFQPTALDVTCNVTCNETDNEIRNVTCSVM